MRYRETAIRCLMSDPRLTALDPTYFKMANPRRTWMCKCRVRMDAQERPPHMDVQVPRAHGRARAAAHPGYAGREPASDCATSTTRSTVMPKC